MIRPFSYALLLLTVCCACGPESQVVTIVVQDHLSERPLDSTRVDLLASAPDDQSETIISTHYTNASGMAVVHYTREEAMRYSIRSDRRFYQPIVNEEGDQYLSISVLGSGDSLYLVHKLAKIEAPDPGFLSEIRKDLSLEEMLSALTGNQWNFALLPHLKWKDIPALLALGGDTTLITHYPAHPTSSYRPRHARVGLVALWLVEAIRKTEMMGTSDELQNLVPPSRAPVLGTSQGNPSGKNSAEQVKRAQSAYQTWYHTVETAPRNRRINEMRNIPLRNEGMSWM